MFICSIVLQQFGHWNVKTGSLYSRLNINSLYIFILYIFLYFYTIYHKATRNRRKEQSNFSIVLRVKLTGLARRNCCCLNKF